MDKHGQPPPYSSYPPQHQQQAYPQMPMPQPMAPAPPIGITIPPPMINYGPESQQCVCPHCHAQIRSSTKTEATTKTHISALLLCCFLCWPCACLPYCMDSCQNVNHYCPNCQAFLGSYQS